MMRWVSILVVLAVILVVLFVFLWQRPPGSVTLLVVHEDGSRNVGDYSLATRSLSSRAGFDASTMTIPTTESFTLSDGSTVTVESAGIVKKTQSSGGIESLLVATPVAAFGRTPLAVWKDATRIAWVNPADRSLQVFERNSRGTYLPLYLNKDIHANSLGFTEDDTVLVVTKLGSENTEIMTVTLSTGAVQSVSSVSGFAAIISAP